MATYVYCKSEAATMGVASCHEGPLMAKYGVCMKTDYIAEATDCVTSVTDTQVAACLTTFSLGRKNASAVSVISTAFETCDDIALLQYERSRNMRSC
jgi:hypothetical protein